MQTLMAQMMIRNWSNYKIEKFTQLLRNFKYLTFLYTNLCQKFKKLILLQ